MISQHHRTAAGSVNMLCQKEGGEFRVAVDHVRLPVDQTVYMGPVHRMLYPHIRIDLVCIKAAYVDNVPVLVCCCIF